jgi:NAD(P)-dependent dehydrogenase (short-subunit alcohol dehydrogenase family)
MSSEHQSASVGHASMLKERVAVVTGCAQGIGLAIARTLTEYGANVVMNDINEATLTSAATSLEDIGGPSLQVVADISQSAEVEMLTRRVNEKFGHIDILVNNAGYLICKNFLDLTEQDWDRSLAVNLRAMFLCCRAVLPGMISARKGAIVNIASTAAFHTTIPHIPYSVAKAGVVALTRDLAYEMAPFGIRVNAVAPGNIVTPMSDGANQESHTPLSHLCPLGHMGSPRDIAEAVAYLASDLAKYVVGTTLKVNGGFGLSIMPPAVTQAT